MKYARVLTNLYPADGRLRMRAGYSEWATGLTSDVETLMEYAAGGTSTLFAAAGTSIFDVTASGAVGAAVVTSLTNARWQFTMHATTSGQYLVLVNGADGVRTWSGAAWATQSITNVTAADLVAVCSHKARLWFIEGDTLKLWYLATYGISGAATKLDLGALCKEGGELLAIATWSFDGGAGPDDLLVAVTTKGEVLIYQGTDPASDWGLVGIFKVDTPIGRRCLIKYGADLAVLTSSGAVKLRDVLLSADRKDGFSEVVRDQFISAYRDTGTNFGWGLSSYQAKSWLLVNVPTLTADTYDQFIYSIPYKAWWKCSGLPAISWAETTAGLFFGGPNGTVYQADTGLDDNGAAINVDYQPSWSDFGTSQQKLFTMMRPNLFTDGEPLMALEMRVDYDDRAPTADFSTTVTAEGSDWDVDAWDAGVWAGGVIAVAQWGAAVGRGVVGAPRLRFQTLTTEFEIAAVDLVFQVSRGNVL